uniref:U2A'/phosphoprotein 32 family A C-terminal domain-containing protein n=1 Tax=Globisporangium ultimum (strain ATCC 200006 / CBS 805.95 / DAOM BR144) TaxID=431595 RepID=K3WRB1_GLOUD
MVASAIDLREEMDASAVLNQPFTVGSGANGNSSSEVAPLSIRKPIEPSKARFMIRTLPKDCNPTPVTARNAHGAQLLSPTANKKHSALAAETEMHLPDNPFDDITEEKLQKLSGKQDLSRVTYLQISVDSGKQSVEVVGELLPSLQQLKLQNSTLHSFRDLGTSLHSLQILWVMRSGINDLDGIGALTGLQELYLQYNDISDLSPLTLHDEIQVIDLEGNCVSDVGQIEQLVTNAFSTLAFCAQLTALNLEANPVCKIAYYRQIVANFLPQLTTLDDKPITEEERAKISDDDIDAAIKAHQDELAAASLTPATVDDKLLIADGIKSSLPPSHYDDRSPRRLSRSSSTQRVVGFDPALDAMKRDSGSSLTHGTDIVFAGNVTSALRRHRSESEPDSQFNNPAVQELQQNITGIPASVSKGSQLSNNESISQFSALERPKTPARVSITDTLDRANELETHKHKSRDAILNELKAWQQEGIVSQVGVTHVSSHREHDSSPSKASIKRKTPNHTKTSERRPNTSAGVLRNGVSLREAFVDTRKDKESNTVDQGKSRAKTPSLHRRSSYTPPSMSSGTVDILILDEGDERRPCSPKKSSKGIFTTGPSGPDWNLDALSPKLDIGTAESSWRNFPLSSPREDRDQNDRVFQKSARSGGSEDGEDSDSSSSDSETKSGSAQSKSRRHSRPSQSTFFNVAESLHAIDKWRDEMDDGDAFVSVGSPRTRTLSSRDSSVPSVSKHASRTSTPSTNTQQKEENDNQGKTTIDADYPPCGPMKQSPQALQLGPANYESDERIVQYMKDKHKCVAETKTREGFRRYFHGIEADRLEKLLQRVFSDPEKVRRRLQLMSGLYRHELPS